MQTSKTEHLLQTVGVDIWQKKTETILRKTDVNVVGLVTIF